MRITDTGKLDTLYFRTETCKSSVTSEVFCVLFSTSFSPSEIITLVGGQSCTLQVLNPLELPLWHWQPRILVSVMLWCAQLLIVLISLLLLIQSMAIQIVDCFEEEVKLCFSSYSVFVHALLWWRCETVLLCLSVYLFMNCCVRLCIPWCRQELSSGNPSWVLREISNKGNNKTKTRIKMEFLTQTELIVSFVDRENQ